MRILPQSFDFRRRHTFLGGRTRRDHYLMYDARGKYMFLSICFDCENILVPTLRDKLLSLISYLNGFSERWRAQPLFSRRCFESRFGCHFPAVRKARCFDRWTTISDIHDELPFSYTSVHDAYPMLRAEDQRQLFQHGLAKAEH